MLCAHVRRYVVRADWLFVLKGRSAGLFDSCGAILRSFGRESFVPWAFDQQTQECVDVSSGVREMHGFDR